MESLPSSFNMLCCLMGSPAQELSMAPHGSQSKKASLTIPLKRAYPEPSYDTSSQLLSPMSFTGLSRGFSGGPPSKCSGWPMSEGRPEPVPFNGHTLPWCQVLRAASCPTHPTRWQCMGGRTGKAHRTHEPASCGRSTSRRQ